MPRSLTALLLATALLAIAPAQSRITSDEGPERLGHVLLAHDLDGDGKAEIIAGAPRNGFESSTTRGRVIIARQSGENAFEIETWRGFDAGHQFGSAIAIGDITGDGVPEIVVGAPGAHRNRGQIHVWKGSRDGGSFLSGGVLRERPSWITLEGADDNGSFGASLAIGDLDGDGIGDLIVGAPTTKVGKSSPYAGKVHVLRGRKRWVDGVAQLGKKTYRPELVVLGRENEGLGHALVAGDLDADGVDDLAIGSPWLPRNGVTKYGAVVVVSGQRGGLKKRGTFALDEQRPAREIRGSGGELGHVLLGHDLDGDGKPELLIGDPAAAVGRSKGAGRILGIARSAPATIDLKSGGKDIEGVEQLRGSVANEGLASALWTGHAGGREDVPDLLIGSPEAGRVVLILDAAPLPASPIPTKAFMPRGNVRGFGTSVCAGDVDGDGEVEVIIAAPDAGQIFVY